MKKLDFHLHEFTRYAWVSDQARIAWEPRFHRIAQCWQEIEWLSVLSGIRSCTLKSVSPEQLPELSTEVLKEEFIALPLEMQGVSHYGYSTSSVKAEAGKPFQYRVVIGRAKDVLKFKDAWERRDDRGIGLLLGFPTCCRDFFEDIWIDRKLKDTSWPMAINTTKPVKNSFACEIEGTDPKANILLRWLGLRAVFHLPCSFNCKATIELADKLIEVGRNNGYSIEMDWLLHILSWPVEWSAFHGIAEIKTPVIKISTSSDATAEKYIVRFKGSSYPPEGAKGLTFPFNVEENRTAPAFLSDEKECENPTQKTVPPDKESDWYFKDNHFSSKDSMLKAHKPIVELAVSTLANKPGNILDLGCGNGVLLKRICQENPHLVPFGVEIDAEKILHARELLPAYGENFFIGNMFDLDEIWSNGQHYSLVILMPGRLLETAPAKAKKLLNHIRQCSSQLLVYAYGDRLKKYKDLSGLAGQVGLRLLSPGNGISAGMAALPG